MLPNLSDNSWLLYITVLLLAAAVLFIHKQKTNIAVTLLFLAAVVIRLFMAHLDPFLHDWDEKFHALVARNMMKHPFKPMLKTNILAPYEYTLWCCNHIWLHKQPLFMWQMALSMKLFGVSEFTIRYPSVLMGALMVPMLYRIAVLYTKNTYIAFAAALFMCCSNYQLQITSGVWGMDHNDVAFGFYILASIWAYTEYINKRSLKWVLLIGVFAGCAILNKWLTGLLVFSGWGLNILLSIRSKESKREILDFLLALLVCVIVFMPWQIYIFKAFPREAAYEFAFNTQHVFTAVEGHKGHNEFYLNKFHRYFGEYIWLLIFAGLLTVWFIKTTNSRINIALVTCFIIVYCFFSYIVKTKVMGYFFIVAPIGYILMAISMYVVLKIPKVGRGIFILLVGIMSYILFDSNEIRITHNKDDSYRQMKIYNNGVYKHIYNFMPDDIDVVMNLYGMTDVEVMFYNPGIDAIHYCYDEETFRILKKEGKKIAVFDSRFGYNLPYYIKKDKDVFIINKELKPTSNINE